MGHFKKKQKTMRFNQIFRTGKRHSWGGGGGRGGVRLLLAMAIKFYNSDLLNTCKLPCSFRSFTTTTKVKKKNTNKKTPFINSDSSHSPQGRRKKKKHVWDISPVS